MIALLLFASTARADEPAPAFVTLWQRLAAAPPAEAAPAWQAFAKEHPKDDLGQVAQLLGGIATLRDGTDDAHVAAALACFRIAMPDEAKGDPPATDMRKQLAAAGKAWAARAQMALLARKLQTFYRKNVAYPEALDELIKPGLATDADLTDPFGKRFEYQARARRNMPAIARQVYTLRCSTIEADHASLPAALAQAAEGLGKVQIDSLKPKDGQAFVRWTAADGSTSGARRWVVGEKEQDLVLWSVGENYLIAGQKDVPKVVVK